MTEARRVESERVGDVQVITLARPEKLNAWNRAMREALGEMLVSAGAQPDVRAVVLTGKGDRAFCAGADMGELATLHSPEQIRQALDEWKTFYGRILGLRKPLIVALNGLAAGSGFQVALMGDVRVAHAGVTMGQTEIRSGIPSVTGSALMARRLGTAVAVELALSGRMMAADEAVRLGLVNRLVAPGDVRGQALALARELGARSPEAVRWTKQWFQQQELAELDAAFAFAQRAQAAALVEGDMAGHVNAFVDKSSAAPAAPSSATPSATSSTTSSPTR